MDRDTLTRTLIAGLIAVGLMVGWQYVSPYFFPPEKPAPPPAPAPAAPKAPPGEKAPSPAPTPAPGPETPAVKPLALQVAGARAPAAPVVLGSAAYETLFDLEAAVDARGAGLRRLVLSRHGFLRTVNDRALPKDERAPMVLVEPEAPYAAFTIPQLRLRLKGADRWEAPLDLSEKNPAAVWKVESQTANPASVTLSAEVQDGDGQRLLKVLKTLTVYARDKPAAAGGENVPQYEMRMKLEFAAADDRVEKVSYSLQGSPALPPEGIRGESRLAVAGTWSGAQVEVHQIAGKDIKKADGAPPGQEPRKPIPGNEVAWIGEVDKYFAVILIPDSSLPKGLFAAEAFQYTVTEGGKDVPLAGVRLLSKELPVAPGRPVVNEFAVFAGAKDHEYLDKYYRAIALPDLIVWASCCVPIPGLQPIGRFLVTVLDAFHALVRNYGIAIILLVIVLRVLLLPISRWSAKSMVGMQKMAPKMQKIREEFANDPKRMQEEMAKIGGLKQMGGCLPMFLQMPIWIGLYGALNAAIQLRHAAFLPSAWLPAGSVFLQDLSAPDSLLHWQTPVNLPGQDIPLLGWLVGSLQGFLTGGAGGITNFNLLPILVGVAFYLQQKMTPQPPAANPQGDQQRKMMNFMMIFMALMMYSVPSGLSLYIVTSSVLGFFEYKYFRKKWMQAPEPAEAAPAALPAADAKEQSQVKGREKSLAERVESWVKRRMGPAAEKPDEQGWKKRKKR